MDAENEPLTCEACGTLCDEEEATWIRVADNLWKCFCEECMAGRWSPP